MVIPTGLQNDVQADFLTDGGYTFRREPNLVLEWLRSSSESLKVALRTPFPT